MSTGPVDPSYGYSLADIAEMLMTASTEDDFRTAQDLAVDWINAYPGDRLTMGQWVEKALMRAQARGVIPEIKGS